MRGGIFDHNYLIENSDFKNYIKKANKEIASKYSSQIDDLGNLFTLKNLRKLVKKETILIWLDCV